MKSKLKYLFLLGVLLSCMGLTSCNDDDDAANASQNLVFMYTPNTTEYNLVYKDRRLIRNRNERRSNLGTCTM